MSDRPDFAGRVTNGFFFGRDLDLDAVLFRRSRFAIGLISRRRGCSVYLKAGQLAVTRAGLSRSQRRWSFSHGSPGAFNAHETAFGTIRPPGRLVGQRVWQMCILRSIITCTDHSTTPNRECEGWTNRECANTGNDRRLELEPITCRFFQLQFGRSSGTRHTTPLDKAQVLSGQTG